MLRFLRKRKPVEPLRVAICVPSLQPAGGVERWIEGLRDNLPPERATVVHVTERLGSELPADVDVALCWAIPQWSKLYPGWTKPAICVSHGDSGWNVGMIRDLWPGCSHCVAVSERSRRSVPPEVPCTVLLNGVDMRMSVPRIDRDTLRRRWGVPHGAAVLGFLGRYSPEKDPLCVMRAAQAGGNEYFGVVIVPSHQFEEARGELSRNPGHWTVVNQHDHWGDVFHAFDVAFMPSEYEGFGFVAAEAMACGCPVVTTPVGFIPEFEQRFGRLTVQVPWSASGSHLQLAAMTALSAVNRTAVERARRVVTEHLNANLFGRRWAHFLEYACGRRKDPCDG